MNGKEAAAKIRLLAAELDSIVEQEDYVPAVEGRSAFEQLSGKLREVASELESHGHRPPEPL